MSKLNNLNIFQIRYLIELKMETLADMTGYTPKSITRITGWSDDTYIYEHLRIILNTVRMDGITKEDMINVYESLEQVMEEWEKQGK